MGGSSSSSRPSSYDLTPVQAQPMSDWFKATQGVLKLGNGVTEAAIAMKPELRTADTDFLQKTVNREALINALNSRELERTISPDIAALRESLPADVNAEMAGGPSTKLSNLWLKSGLEDAIGTGARLDSGFARSALADSTRRDYTNELERVQTKAAALLSANPEPIAGLDPGAIASNISRVSSENANSRDGYRDSILNFLGNNARDVGSALQQAMQIEAARRSENAAAQNQMKSIYAQLRSGDSAGAAASSAARQGSTNAMIGAGIGTIGAIGGGLLVF